MLQKQPTIANEDRSDLIVTKQMRKSALFYEYWSKQELMRIWNCEERDKPQKGLYSPPKKSSLLQLKKKDRRKKEEAKWKRKKKSNQ